MAQGQGKWHLSQLFDREMVASQDCQAAFSTETLLALKGLSLKEPQGGKLE